MDNSETPYVQHIKKLVEEKLGWIESGKWKQRDYWNLLELLEEESGISISLSTIKRIWKPDFEGSPHPATLDVLAQFVDYKNWLDFKNSTQLITKDKESEKGRSKKNQSSFLNKKTYITSTLLILIVVLVMIVFQSNKQQMPKPVYYDPLDVSFSCKNSVSKGVPNTAIFNYDVSKIEADSFFIQQSWDNTRRDPIKKNKSKLTSTYFFPGYHKAKLIANDSIVKEIPVIINTIGWLALARNGFMDDTPTYINDSNVQRNGELHVNPDHLNNHQVELKKDVMISYYYVNEFENVSSSNFSFETRMKLDSTFQLLCPHISIFISGEGEMNAIPLTIKGCVGKVGMKIGDKTLSGKDNDLSGLGTDIYKWQKFKMVVRDKTAQMYLNQEFIMEVPFDQDIGNITGLNLNFSGTGSVDYVRLWDDKDELVYGNEF